MEGWCVYMLKTYRLTLQPQIDSQPGSKGDVMSVTYDDETRIISPEHVLDEVSTSVTSYSNPYEFSVDQQSKYGLVAFRVSFEDENGNIISSPDDPIAGDLYRIIPEQDIEIVLSPGSSTTGPTITATQHVLEINAAGSVGFAYLDASIDQAYSGTYTSTSTFLAWPKVDIATSFSFRSVEVSDDPVRFR